MSRWAKAMTKLDRKNRKKRRDLREASRGTSDTDKALSRLRRGYRKGGV